MSTNASIIISIPAHVIVTYLSRYFRSHFTAMSDEEYEESRGPVGLISLAPQGNQTCCNLPRECRVNPCLVI